MPTRSGYIHGTGTAVPDSDYVIDVSAVFNSIAPEPFGESDNNSGIITVLPSDSGITSYRQFGGGDDPHEFIIYEPYLYEPNTDSEWYGGYGFSTSFSESDLSTNIVMVRPALEAELDSAQVNAGGGGADQAELDSANSLITTLRGNLNTANSQRDSANTLIVSLRDDLDSANTELGSVSTGPVQRWVT